VWIRGKKIHPGFYLVEHERLLPVALAASVADPVNSTRPVWWGVSSAETASTLVRVLVESVALNQTLEGTCTHCYAHSGPQRPPHSLMQPEDWIAPLDR
jgi:hypothetical protein